MKIAILAIAASLCAAPAFAQSTTVSGSQSGAYSQSGVHMGNNPRQAPAAMAPGLTSSFGTCLGSVGFGGAVPGYGGGFGFTYPDKHCNAREDAKILAALVGGPAAVARMCQVRDNAKALAAVGIQCPGSSVRTSAPAQAPVKAQPTTRVVKAGISMKECLALAKKDKRISCRPR